MESNSNETGRICTPGMRLSVSNDEFVPGSGTTDIMGYIYAIVSGFLKFTEDATERKTTVSVESPKALTLIPRTGDLITARVTAVNPRIVHCTIISLGDYHVLRRPYKGIIKKEDIRINEIDQIDPYKCFKPGDVILARVLPMAEVHYYPLTTAHNDLGVVVAQAEGSSLGVHMVPVSWSEMQCPETLVKEKRKVAKFTPGQLSFMRVNGDLNSKNENGILDEFTMPGAGNTTTVRKSGGKRVKGGKVDNYSWFLNQADEVTRHS